MKCIGRPGEEPINDRVRNKAGEVPNNNDDNDENNHDNDNDNDNNVMIIMVMMIENEIKESVTREYKCKKMSPSIK